MGGGVTQECGSRQQRCQTTCDAADRRRAQSRRALVGLFAVSQLTTPSYPVAKYSHSRVRRKLYYQWWPATRKRHSVMKVKTALLSVGRDALRQIAAWKSRVHPTSPTWGGQQTRQSRWNGDLVHKNMKIKRITHTRGTIKSLTNMTGGLPSRNGAMMPPPKAIKYVMTSDSAQKSWSPLSVSIFLTWSRGRVDWSIGDAHVPRVSPIPLHECY